MAQFNKLVPNIPFIVWVEESSCVDGLAISLEWVLKVSELYLGFFFNSSLFDAQCPFYSSADTDHHGIWEVMRSCIGKLRCIIKINDVIIT